jgi:hypothetical protein
MTTFAPEVQEPAMMAGKGKLRTAICSAASLQNIDKARRMPEWMKMRIGQRTQRSNQSVT